MGASDAGDDQRPIHQVYVSEFFIGRFPVTQDEYARFIRATGYDPPAVRELPLIAGGGRQALFKELAARFAWESGGPPAGHGSHPVVLVRFDDAVAYCRWLSDVAGRPVRLPTEAEWEKAARGTATTSAYPWGDDIDASRCHYLADPSAKHQRGTRPTGTCPPNGYGLCDVVGNVWEWVSDWHGADYYNQSESIDPRGPDTGALRIVRGGSWVSDDVAMLTCAYRHQVPPDTYAYSIGFRVACSAA